MLLLMLRLLLKHEFLFLRASSYHTFCRKQAKSVANMHIVLRSRRVAWGKSGAPLRERRGHE
eukprot:1849013-Heterocapsa_arctica.AAC.1